MRETRSSAYAGFASSCAALDAAEPLGRRQQQPVVGADVQPALAVAQRERPARAADARVDDREVHAGRHVRERVREHERALEHAAGPDAVRDVDDLRVRRDPLHHAVARADEVVLQAEVGQEGDEHQRELTASTQAVEVVSLATATTSRPSARACGGGLRADRDDRHAARRSRRAHAPPSRT